MDWDSVLFKLQKAEDALNQIDAPEAGLAIRLISDIFKEEKESNPNKWNLPELKPPPDSPPLTTGISLPFLVNEGNHVAVGNYKPLNKGFISSTETEEEIPTEVFDLTDHARSMIDSSPDIEIDISELDEPSILLSEIMNLINNNIDNVNRSTQLFEESWKIGFCSSLNLLKDQLSSKLNINIEDYEEDY